MIKKGIHIFREEGLAVFVQKSIKYMVESIKYRVKRRQNAHLISNFEQELFNSREELQSYTDEFHTQGIKKVREEAQSVYEQERSTQTTAMADIGTDGGERLYSLIRKEEPEIVIETGVANGFSSTVILSALEKKTNLAN